MSAKLARYTHTICVKGIITLIYVELEFKCLMVEDPLSAGNAVFVQIRVVLETMLCIRRCPACPDCEILDSPCQDTFGSVAEMMGVIAGCVDAMFGAFECQQFTGSLH